MKKILIFAATALVLAACAQTEGVNETLKGQLLISPVLTRATDTAFESGDQIGVTITTSDGTVYVTNELLTYADGVFSGDLIWYTGSETSTIAAYYPYDESGVPTSFTVATDQTSGVSASDFIAGTASDVTPSESAVTVSFKHQLSKILVKVSNESNYSVSSVKLTGSALTADVDVAALTASASSASETGAITAYESIEDSLYAAIVVPQTVALGLSVTLSSGTEMTAELASATLVQGGQYSVNATVEDNSVNVYLSSDIEDWTDEGEIGSGSDDDDDDSSEPAFEEYDGYFIYDGVTYTTVTLSDGSTWMAEPLRYVPSGYTVSSDPTEGTHIWYPYETDGTTTTALTDDDSVVKYGYLYDAFAAFQTDSTTLVNSYSDFEGCQGICPTGWHIPTRAEYLGLCGYSNKAADESAAVTDSTAVFYDSSYTAGNVSLFNEGGWNFVLTGYRYKVNFVKTNADATYQKTALSSSNTTVEDYYGRPALTYILTSTPYKLTESTTAYNLQFFGLMTTFNTSKYPLGRVTLAYLHCESGTQIRCIKDSSSDTGSDE